MKAGIVLILLLFFMGMRIPIVFSLLLSSGFYCFFLSDISIVVLVHRMSTAFESFPLIAVPLFILAAEFMVRGFIVKVIFEFADTCVGHITGGLGHVNVLASMIFAGMSGSEVADVAGLGKIEMKIMSDKGYDLPFSAAITGASAMIGPIIPPSILMILYGGIASQSVGRLFIGGIFPGILMGLGLMVTVYLISKKRKYYKSSFPGFKLVFRAFLRAFPSLLLPVVTIGGILKGFFTPTEAGVIAVMYAFVLTFLIYRDQPFKEIFPILYEAAMTTAITIIIVGAAAVFGWVITLENIPILMRDFIINFTDQKWVVLLLLNIILLIEGCFFSITSILLIMTPMIIPLANSFGIDLIHLGVVMVLNLCIGFFTPPIGVGLYILSDATNLSIEEISKAMIPFYLPILLVLLLITYFPDIVLFLPHLLMGRGM